ncbi:MAG: isoprenylcysteine carboxylmethyltransferase family protein [Deltaproteobacteria bacterium]|nr:isoprenylcysteine carboxylmethyltransferase family protein [Deltaproteobacteria bacterium]MBT4525710.1 isoprenylcysteine carboxylmethyltransferase family protein [Deltaproteobacteria bacterium]
MSINTLIIGSCCILLGELIRIYGVAYIGGVSRTRTFSTGQNLITGGPFSHVRNPLYIGNLFLSGGLAIFANVGLYFNLIFFAFFFIQYIPVIHWEENNLREIFGKTFDDYTQKVPRWIPSLFSKIEDQEIVTGEYKTALKSERNTLTSAIVLYVLILWRSGWLGYWFPELIQ